jgi:hypothetical protein
LGRNIDVSAFEVSVHAERADEHPRVFTNAVIAYENTGHGVEESAVRRAIELSAVRYCPAQGMLAELFPIRLDDTIYEGDSAEERALVLSDQWTDAANSPPVTAALQSS